MESVARAPVHRFDHASGRLCGAARHPLDGRTALPSKTVACGRVDYTKPLPVRKPNPSVEGIADLWNCFHRQHALRRAPGNLAKTVQRRLAGTDRIHLLEVLD